MSFKNSFINMVRQNLVLVIGLVLPVLLVAIFFFATVIPKSLSQPPQYEMLFSTTRYDYQDASDYLLEFFVKDQRLMLKARKADDKNRNFNKKILMAYDGKTETVREIAVDITKNPDAMAGNEVVLDETKHMTIEPSSMSPDGYVLDSNHYSDGGLVQGLFGGGYRNSGYRLKKGSVGYKIPNTQQNYYYNQLQFIGWVVKK